VVATPHIYPGVFDNTPERIAEVFALLHQEAQARGLGIAMSWGAEVRLCPEILDWLSQDQLPCLGHGTGKIRTVLIEMPDGQVPVGADRLMARLVARGIKPLVAHPERNRAVMESLNALEPLLEAGCVVQLTAASLLGEFGDRAQATARKLLDRGHAVAAVASDAHNLKGRRPRMAAARAWLVTHYGETMAQELTDTSPARLVGVGQVVFEGRNGTVLRDLPVTPSSGDAVRKPAFLLNDFPRAGKPGVPVEPVEPVFRLNEDWDLGLAVAPLAKAGLHDKPDTCTPDTDFAVRWTSNVPPRPAPCRADLAPDLTILPTHVLRAEPEVSSHPTTDFLSSASGSEWSLTDLFGPADFRATEPAPLKPQAPPDKRDTPGQSSVARPPLQSPLNSSTSAATQGRTSPDLGAKKLPAEPKVSARKQQVVPPEPSVRPAQVCHVPEVNNPPVTTTVRLTQEALRAKTMAEVLDAYVLKLQQRRNKKDALAQDLAKPADMGDLTLRSLQAPQSPKAKAGGELIERVEHKLACAGLPTPESGQPRSFGLRDFDLLPPTLRRS
jgi:protein-tyrosine phosphatase